MKFPIGALLAAPALALCATFSGSVILLDGTPLGGAVVKVGTDSAVTSGSGAFALARSAGIASRSGRTVSVTSHLTIENGHPRLSFGGADISGRARASSTRQILSGAALGKAASRSAASSDTLCVYWQGKRLTVLPVASDTAVTFRIDTAWRDDAGIPWNPRIAYGSLRDIRDGQTYRTVRIGNQRWMAENLNYAVDSSWCAGGNASGCAVKGRLYRWSDMLKTIGGAPGSPCPSGWRVPTPGQWLGITDTFLGVDRAALLLKSTAGWPSPGADSLGFRALPNGIRDGDGGFPVEEEAEFAYWWSAADTLSEARDLDISGASRSSYLFSKSFALGLRCLDASSGNLF